MPQVNLDDLTVTLRRSAIAYKQDDSVWILMQRIATDCDALAALLVRRQIEAGLPETRQ